MLGLRSVTVLIGTKVVKKQQNTVRYEAEARFNRVSTILSILKANQNAPE
jgi:hypothetical protein